MARACGIQLSLDDFQAVSGEKAVVCFVLLPPLLFCFVSWLYCVEEAGGWGAGRLPHPRSAVAARRCLSAVCRRRRASVSTSSRGPHPLFPPRHAALLTLLLPPLLPPLATAAAAAATDRTPFLADLKPSGKYVMEDLHNVRGGGHQARGGGAGLWGPCCCTRLVRGPALSLGPSTAPACGTAAATHKPWLRTQAPGRPPPWGRVHTQQPQRGSKCPPGISG